MPRPSWATFSNGRRAPGASARSPRCRCSTAAAARPASRTQAASSTSRERATASRCSSPSGTSRTSFPRCACWRSSPRRRIAPSPRPAARPRFPTCATATATSASSICSTRNAASCATGARRCRCARLSTRARWRSSGRWAAAGIDDQRRRAMNQIVERNLQRLPLAREYSKARLGKPARSGYLFLAAEVDAHPPFLWASRNKRRLIEDCAGWCARIARDPGVLEAAAFQAILIPPFGDTTFLHRRRNEFHRARFDLALLVETDSVERAEGLRTSPLFRAFETHVRGAAGHVYTVTASNAKRIGAVDHARDGVFL